MRTILLLFGLLIGTDFAALDCNAEPMTCQIDVRSTDGGRLEVVTMDDNPKMPFTIPLAIIWHPPSTSASIDLVVGYPNATLHALGKADAHRVLFHSSDPHFNSKYQAIVDFEKHRLNIKMADIHIWSGHGSILFIEGRKATKMINRAIDKGYDIGLNILMDGKSIAGGSFNASALKGRDQLLSQARILIEERDPSVCRPI